MGVGTPLGRALVASACVAASVVVAEAQLQNEPRPCGEDEVVAPVVVEWSGRAGAAGRGFPGPASFSGQRSLATGFIVEPTLYLEGSAGASFTVSPFFRYDHSDPRRTHLDLREAYFLFFSDVGDGGWEARLGVGQVFWGVAESQHLVDIVNQVDLVEHPNGGSKLGQPMAHVTWFGDWGTLELVGMPWHRARTFPGRRGRLRLPPLIDHTHVEYEGRAGRWRPAVASRYSRSFGAVDLGVSVFDGTSREPFFLEPLVGPGGAPTLVQHYGLIRQLGQDVQVTLGSWLLKAEAIQRSGARSLVGRPQAYAATVLGGEYAFYAVGGSGVDVTLVGEWSFDSRGPTATPGRSANVLENDVFFAGRAAFNDVQSTELTLSALADVRRATRALALEFRRRVSNAWSLRAEAVALLSVDPLDHFHAMRHDSFLDVSLVYHF